MNIFYNKMKCTLTEITWEKAFPGSGFRAHNFSTMSSWQVIIALTGIDLSMIDHFALLVVSPLRSPKKVTRSTTLVIGSSILSLNIGA